MSEAAFHKITCNLCGGSVEYPAESEGATVPCPHCGKNLFLYRVVRAVGTPPVSQPAIERPTTPPILDSKNKYQTFAEVPWFRREPGPITLLLALVLSPILLALCITALTGDVYRNAYDKNGNLVTWGIANKIAAILFLVIQFGLAVIYYETNHSGSSQANAVQSAQQAQVTPAPQPQQEQTQAAPEPAPAQSESVQLDWNREENDAMKNGNVAFAVQKILANPDLRNQASIQEPQMVAKTPYNYYGQIIKFTGTVAVVQDYAAGSDNAIAGKESSDIVTVTSDQTIVEIFCMKSSGDMRVRDNVNLYGYPVGVTEVPNRVGGNDVHLIVVGNDYDDLGAAQ